MFCQLTRVSSEGYGLPVVRIQLPGNHSTAFEGHVHWLSDLTEAQRQSVGYASWAEPDCVDERTHRAGAALDTLSDTGVTRTFPAKEYRPVVDLQRDKLALLAAHRWNVENGGMVHDDFSAPTDDRAKTLIMGASIAAKEDATYTVVWKVRDGVYVTLDAPALIALADALKAHVRAAFAAEKAHAEVILIMDDPATVVEHDIRGDIVGAAWPANPDRTR